MQAIENMVLRLEQLRRKADRLERKIQEARRAPQTMGQEHDPWYRVNTLCEICDKACGGCCWSDKEEQAPVPGWVALRRDLAVAGKYAQPGNTIESYVVLGCPEFVLHPEDSWAMERWDPEWVALGVIRGKLRELEKSTDMVRLF